MKMFGWFVAFCIVAVMIACLYFICLGFDYFKVGIIDKEVAAGIISVIVFLICGYFITVGWELPPLF